MFNEDISREIASNFLRVGMIGSVLLVLFPRSMTAADAFWDGGGDGRSWHDPLNWSSNVVPDSASDVIVDVPGRVTVTHTNGNTTVQSLRCEESFVLAGGSLTLTKGLSQLNGSLRIDAGTSLQAIGNTTLVAASGMTDIDDASLYVSSGAVLSLPALRSYSGLACCGWNWQASGAGSVLDLAGLTNFTGSDFYPLRIEALAGGQIVLSNVTRIEESVVSVLADGANSKVNLSGLTTFDGTNGTLRLEARSEGSVLVPQLVDGRRVALTLRPGGNANISQFRRLLSITADGVGLNLPDLGSLSGGGELRVINGGTVAANTLADTDNTSIYVSGGTVLSLPAVRNYSGLACCGWNWQAMGTGSVLDLSGLTNFTGSGFYPLRIEALAGGQIVLSNVTRIEESVVAALAEGANSVVNLSGLTDFDGTNGTLRLEARSEGSVLVPKLADGRRVALTLRAGGMMTTEQFRRLLDVTVVATTVTLAGVTNVDSGSLLVNGGGTLSLPNLQSYRDTSGGCCVARWEANGAGSRLHLPALTDLAGHPIWSMSVQALAGGVVDMPALETISSGRIALLADGAGSGVNLDQLSSFITRSGQSSLETRNGGGLVLNDQAFLLANVAVNIEPGNPVLPSVVVPSAALTLYGRAWHSYRIEYRDARMAHSSWRVYQRLPLTNVFQMVAASVPPNLTFRVIEFVAAPAILDLRRVTSQSLEMVFYGLPGKTYRLLSTASLVPPIPWQPGETVTMTNSFRLFPSQPATETARFYSAKEE